LYQGEQSCNRKNTGFYSHVAIVKETGQGYSFVIPFSKYSFENNDKMLHCFGYKECVEKQRVGDCFNYFFAPLQHEALL